MSCEDAKKIIKKVMQSHMERQFIGLTAMPQNLIKSMASVF